MKIQIVVLFAIIGAMAAQESQIYCGRRLARTLAAVCFYQQDMKRSEYDGLGIQGMKRSEYYGYEVGYSSPWMTAVEAQGLAGGRGKRTGVADECCDKPCTMDELMSYC